MTIELNNLTEKKINSRFIKNLVKNILKKAPLDFTTLSIAFIPDLEMKQLNKKYRKKNKITDVLSFHYGDSGEIVICYNQTQKQAKAAGHSIQKELVIIIVHSILHLKDYEHEKSQKQAEQMRQKEEEILQYLQEKS